MPAPFSESFRAQLKKAYEDGKDDKTIRKEYNVSGGKVKKMRDSFNACGEVWVPTKYKAGGGRPRKITIYQEDELKKFMDSNPDAYVKDLTYFLNSRFDLDVDDVTVWRTVVRRGWRTSNQKKPRERCVRGFWLPPTEKDGELIPAQWRETGDRSRKPGSMKGTKQEKKPKLTANERMVERTRAFVKQHMVAPRFDASHDAGHVLRVEKLALHLLKYEKEKHPETLYDPIVLSMAALMHDVEDHKYVPAPPLPQQPSQPQPTDMSFATPQSNHQDSSQTPQVQTVSSPQQPSTPQTQTPSFPWPAQVPPPSSSTPTPAVTSSQITIQSEQAASQPNDACTPETPQTPSVSNLPTNNLPTQPTRLTPQQYALSDHLRTVKCAPHLIHILIHMIPCISHSFSLAQPELVAEIRSRQPELALVQDADRLDALGAIGISRAFCYSGMQRRGMSDTFTHFKEKLETLADGMYTEEAKRIARFRAEKLKGFKEAWDEEAYGWDYAPSPSTRVPGMLHGQRPREQMIDDRGQVFVAADAESDVDAMEEDSMAQHEEQEMQGDAYAYGHAPLPPNVDPTLRDPTMRVAQMQGHDQSPTPNGMVSVERRVAEADPGRQLAREMYGAS